MNIHYRVLEPVHLEFNFFNADGEKVRTISRDHTLVGAEHNLIWDGRDDDGLPLPDGKYTLRVQNYEFSFEIDVTPPALSLELFDAYTYRVVGEGTPYEKQLVNVSPRIEWQVFDINFNEVDLQIGEGSSPDDWESSSVVSPLLYQYIQQHEEGDGVIRERFLSLDVFVNNRLRLTVDDKAGNSNSTSTQLGKEELIVSGFGQLDVIPVAPKNNIPVVEDAFKDISSIYKVISPILYAPMDDLDGSDEISSTIEPRQTRFLVYETIRKDIVQMDVQYKERLSGVDPHTVAWSQMPVDGYLVTTGLPSEFPVVTSPPRQHKLHVKWTPVGLKPNATYIVRLRTLDSDGQEHFSNVFRFVVGGYSFNGLFPKRTSDVYRQIVAPAVAKLDPPFSPDVEVGLWGQQFLGRPVSEVQLFVKSADDPRYAVDTLLDSVPYPEQTFIFRSEDLQSCIEYEGYIVFYGEEDVSGSRPELGRTGYVRISMPCLRMETYSKIYFAEQCGGPSPKKVQVQLTPKSEDNSNLTLLTLSRIDSEGGEDVVFNVNDPESKKTYTYDIDTSGLPEGPLNYSARIINENDDELTRSVEVLVDHTPSTPDITYPLEGQRICGIPTLGKDGVTRNVVTLEGDITDNNKFHYELSNGLIPENVAEVWHDSRSMDSSACSGADSIKDANGDNECIRKVRGDLHISQSKTGPIAAVFDKTGDISARLHVYDSGGFQQCITRSFYLDANVEALPPHIDHKLISPNADGVLDELTITHEVDEPVFLDIDIYNAVLSEKGYVKSGNAIGNIITGQSLLPGVTTTTWDGTNNTIVVPDGMYILAVTYRDACNISVTRNIVVGIDNTPPAVAITYPQTSDLLQMMIEVQGTVVDPHLQGYKIEYGLGHPPEDDGWIKLGEGLREITAPEVLALWNTNGLSGEYAVRLSASDTAGNSSELIVPLNLAERSDLLTYLDAVPGIFSPNGDGRLENTAVRVGLSDKVGDIVLNVDILDSAENVQNSIVSDLTVTNQFALNYQWDGRNEAGDTVLADGIYTARVQAELAANAAVNQIETVQVVVDTTPPLVEVNRPLADGYVKSEGGIVGTISDLHISTYSVEMSSVADGLWKEMRTGTTNTDTDAVLGSLQGLGEGEYQLRINANDEAENITKQTIKFTVDNTPPKVELNTPEKGTILGVAFAPIDLTGLVEDPNLAFYTLNIGAGATPNTWTELIRSEQLLSASDILTVLDVSVYQDGIYTLELYAEDKAGNTTSSKLQITIDNTAPDAAITTPEETGYIKEPINIVGTADDPNISEYKVYVAPGEKTDAELWSEIGGGTTSVNEGILINWSALPPDGVNTLKLVVNDKAGNISEVLVQVNVDTHPPSQPTGLVAEVEDKHNVRLSWNANPEPDVVGYHVYRDGVKITTTPVPEPGYLDLDLADSVYEYTVIAVDRAEWESIPSEPATVRLDTTPPTTRISSPSDGGKVSGLYDIRGTAYSEDDFKEYRLYAGRGAVPDTWQLLRQSPVPVLGDILSEWNTVILPEGETYVLRLEAEDISGNVGTEEVTVTIDNLPPAAPTGLVAVANDSDVNTDWNDNTEIDLLGYLLYRDDRLVNVYGVVVGDLKPYAIKPSQYLDADLPDGVYTYTVYAIDDAGNVSDSSLPSEVTVDTRPPHAIIVEPEDGHAFDNTQYILATSEDSDIANVQFQYRAEGETDWVNMGDPDTQLPYETVFDPTSLGLAYGRYELQAVATDIGEKVDSAPEFITLSYQDLTAPDEPQNLAAKVNGGDITLTWDANSAGDLAGYHIDRIDQEDNVTRLTSAPLDVETYLDSGLDDATYRYRIVAIDVSDNESDPSSEATGVVYTPVLVQPYFPVQTPATVSLTGKGVVQSTLSGSLVNTGGEQSLPEMATDSDGNFILPAIELADGANLFTVVLTDDVGNVSKEAVVGMVVGAAPSQPQGLNASALDYDVTLTWNDNPETNLLGYRVFRNEEPLLPDVQVTGLTATSSSKYSRPEYAVDTNQFSYWWLFESWGEPLEGQWLAVELPDPKLISRLEVDFYSESTLIVDYDIEAWTGMVWVKVAEVKDNETINNIVDLPQPYYSSQLRLVIRNTLYPGDSNDQVSVRSFRVYARQFSEAAEYIDTAPDGNHSYTVTAVNNLGFESIPSEPAALPVGDVEPPEAVTLLAVVSGSDVLLSWDASISTDVVKYHLYRDGELITEHTNLADLTSTDAGRPNGTYTYLVKAVDAAGNESLSSNEASATVSITVLPSPIDLTVTAVPEGGALDLLWAPAIGSTPSGYRVMRAKSTGGPYGSVADVSDTVYQDSGLENGVRYFYVVVALDAVGNASAYSNEADGVPQDTVAPDVSLHYPTVPGKILNTDKKHSAVNGLSEPGASIEVYNNGIHVADVTAASELQKDETSIVESNVTMSPDGKLVAIDDGSQNISLYEFSSDSTSSIISLSTSNDSSIEWLPDSSEFVYLDYDNETGYSVVRRYDISTGISTDLITSVTAYIYGVRLSPGGEELAVIANNYDLGMSGVFLVNISSGQWQHLADGDTWEFNPHTLKWSPNGERLLYRRNHPDNTLEVVDVETGVTTILEDTSSSTNPSWSPDGTRVAATSEYQIWVYDIVAQTATQITSESKSHYSPIWTKDGKALIYYVDDSPDRLDIYSFADGASSILLRSTNWFDYRTLHANSSGYVGVLADGDFHRITLPGFFSVDGVQLKPGDNIVTATATDESENTSILSEAIIINRVLGDQPDLRITQDDLRIIPAAPTIGEKARVTALVRNLGDAPSPQASISLLAVDSDGNSIVLAKGDLLNPIIPGGSQAVAADWSVVGDLGTYTLLAIVDQYNTVDESSESNNLALRDILVTDEARPQLSLTIDKESYSLSEDLLSEVVLTNNGALFSGSLQIVIEDSAGRLVQVILNQQVSDLAYSESRTINSTWNTGSTFADQYKVHASLLDADGLVISDDVAPFTISAIAGLSSAVSTDRASYDAGDNVRITGSINYSDGNSMFSNATAYLRLEDSSGNLLAETSKTLGDMLPSDNRTVTLDWNTGTNMPGSYPVVLEVKQDGRLVTSSSSVVNIDVNGSRLGGSLVVSETTPSRGTPVIASFTVDNLGNTTLDQLPITVSIVDPDLQEAVLSYSENQDIVPGSTYSSSTSFDTATLSLKNYNVVLQAEITNSEGVLENVVLQSLNIRIVDRVPPAVSITQPTAGSYIRGDAPVLISAKDADSKISSVDLSVNGGAWKNAPIHDGVNNLYGLLLPDLQQGPHQVQARGTDSANNTSLSTVVDFTVDNTPPVITIAGVSEDGAYNSVVTPVITIVEENPAQQFISLNTQEYVSGSEITADGSYILTVHASDLAGNTSTAEINFIVDTTPPDIVVNGVEDDGLYNTDITPEILVTDTNLSSSTFLLNGQPYTPGTVITNDGEHKLDITAVDIAGNQSDLTIQFVIDKTPPVVTITSPEEGDTLNTQAADILGMTEQEATVYVSLPGYETSVLALETGEFSFAAIPLEEGLNTLNFHAVDKAGNAGAVTTLTVMVVLQGAELHGSIKPAAGYLILTSKGYLCGGHDGHDNGDGCRHDCYFGKHCNCGCEGKDSCKDKGDCGKKGGCGDKDHCGCGKDYVRNSDDEKNSHSSQTFSNNLSFKKKTKHEGNSKSECEFGTNFSSKGDSGKKHDSKSECNSKGNSDCGAGGKNGHRCDHCYGKHGTHCKKWHKCKSARLLRLVESILYRDGHDYLIVTDEREFVAALRSQRYGTIVVLDDGHLKSSIGSTIRNEIKAQIASGGSFILLSDADGRWKDIVGAKPKGVIHRLSSVELPDSPASEEGAYALDGRGERVRLYGGIPIGTLNSNAEYPAMVLNSLGSGNSVMLTYDPSNITENDNAETVVTNILAYATSSRSKLIAGEYGDITWLVSELDAPIKVELDEELSVEMVFAEVFDGDITSTNTATWVRELAESQDTFSAIVKLPFQKGTYQSSVDLFEILDSGNTLLKEETLEIEVAYDRNDVAVDIITSLSTLDLSDRHDWRKRDQALEMVQRAVGIEIRNKRDVEYVLRKLLYAYEKLEHIREPIPEILSEMGMLIRAYQLEWYELDD